jgi:hypothetical protein
MKEQNLFIDQFGQVILAKTVKELKEKAGSGKVSKMFIDDKSGKTFHVGYVVGRRWFTKYQLVKKEASL